MSELKQLLLEAPDGQLDASMKPLIEKWDDEPTPLQVLEVLDWCVWGGNASGFTMNVLHSIFDDACVRTSTTREEVEKHATWRKNF